MIEATYQCNGTDNTIAVNTNDIKKRQQKTVLDMPSFICSDFGSVCLAKMEFLPEPKCYRVTEKENSKKIVCWLCRRCSDSQISPITLRMPRASRNLQLKS